MYTCVCVREARERVYILPFVWERYMNAYISATHTATQLQHTLQHTATHCNTLQHTECDTVCVAYSRLCGRGRSTLCLGEADHKVLHTLCIYVLICHTATHTATHSVCCSVFVWERQITKCYTHCVYMC